MKNTILAIGLLFTLSAIADIEHVPGAQSKATPEEVSKSRACFQELLTQGCGDPGDDQQHFRSCLSNVYPTLTKDCKKMMSELYGNK